MQRAERFELDAPASASRARSSATAEEQANRHEVGERLLSDCKLTVANPI
jgi:hypothetical protein